ncbi:ankyrin repeat domain-containing protein [Wolbachia endosymbiont of Drosophila mauritiana]|uniref:ankyrin repeat domain-containing protein n=1 Tax=unclassified Wolbachia TaxID=2640676 RepID=UPI0003A01AD4|nr:MULTISPECIES: ankyrin repeat domain-containing protein [unclassified Wolbachia]QCB62766.1 ankyrin repeat domain-containing protein [Wolbachia endosymbiont of Drosophila mauritiana]QCB63811.1 ankyrin repeat domain-containing protein [Wolbachia endosymbiont of Drosophila mauritiana]TGB07360.1 ankyrin repeat domain-containing protein [Wolbachia endosymbiont of Drosophila mauritiana]
MTLNNNNLLISSAREGDLSKVEKFLEKGADIDAKDNDGYTALHLAAKYGHLNVAEKLLEKGASFDIKTNRGYAPLQYTYFHMNPCKEHQRCFFYQKQSQDS